MSCSFNELPFCYSLFTLKIQFKSYSIFFYLCGPKEEEGEEGARTTEEVGSASLTVGLINLVKTFVGDTGAAFATLLSCVFACVHARVSACDNWRSMPDVLFRHSSSLSGRCHCEPSALVWPLIPMVSLALTCLSNDVIL